MSTLVARKNLRCVFAALFVVVLLGEWGSHSVTYANSASADGQAVSANEGGHEDPCKTLVRCTDGRRQNHEVPTPGHDLSQHNAFLDQFGNSRRMDSVYQDPRIARAKINELFRPVSPPFHPPEIS